MPCPLKMGIEVYIYSWILYSNPNSATGMLYNPYLGGGKEEEQFKVFIYR